jgi:hypothetical protein
MAGVGPSDAGPAPLTWIVVAVVTLIVYGGLLFPGPAFGLTGVREKLSFLSPRSLIAPR